MAVSINQAYPDGVGGWGVLRCTVCGAEWRPANARGKAHPTDSSVDREVKAHFATCPERNTP